MTKEEFLRITGEIDDSKELQGLHSLYIVLQNRYVVEGKDWRTYSKEFRCAVPDGWQCNKCTKKEVFLQYRGIVIKLFISNGILKTHYTLAGQRCRRLPTVGDTLDNLLGF